MNAWKASKEPPGPNPSPRLPAGSRRVKGGPAGAGRVGGGGAGARGAKFTPDALLQLELVAQQQRALVAELL